MADVRVHPFAAKFPMLKPDELQELADDIAAHGLIHPIVRDTEGQIVDGRNRLAACKLVGVEPTYVMLPEDVEPRAYILSANVHRRMLSAGQRAMAFALENTFARKVFSGPGRGHTGEVSQRVGAINIAGTTQSYVSMACTVIEYTPHLVDQVMEGGNLNEAYDKYALPEKQRRDKAATYLRNLRVSHPDLADQVDAGTLTLEQAKAAAETDTNETLQARFRARALAEIKLAIEEIGPAVPLPPAPDLTMVWDTPDGKPEIKDGAPGLDEADLKQTQEFLQRLRTVREELEAISKQPPVAEFVMMPGGVANGVRQWASQTINSIYKTVEVYEQAQKDGRKLRSVQ